MTFIIAALMVLVLADSFVAATGVGKSKAELANQSRTKLYDDAVTWLHEAVA